MGDRNLYEKDILTWSDQQAAVLRRLAMLPGLPNELDLQHLAEEIEDVGHGELRDAQDLLQRVLVQLVVSRAAPDAEPDWQWTGNIVNWLSEAELCLSPSMRDLVSFEDLWKRAVRQAVQRFDIAGDDVALARAKKLVGSTCPFALDDMVKDDFRISQAPAKLTALAGVASD
jgi:hypothetical protein